MLNKEIYEEAIQRIKRRRADAQRQQEARTEEVYRLVPEAVELDKQLRNTCLAIWRAALSDRERDEKLKQVQQNSKDADKMLRQLLTARGFPADYLDLHYSCERCSDTGFVGGHPCECLKREIGTVGAEKLNASSPLSLSSFETFDLSYYRDLPPEQFHAMEHIYEECIRYAENFSRGKTGTLTMIGNTGLGKTHLSLSIANVLLRKGYGVVYDSADSMLQRLERERFARGSDPGDTLGLLLDCDLLIIDDFGTEFSTAFTRSTIYTLINSRCSAGKALIVNTNLSAPELQAQYGDRILSRLLTGKVLRFYGSDIRLRKSRA